SKSVRTRGPIPRHVVGCDGADRQDVDLLRQHCPKCLQHRWRIGFGRKELERVGSCTECAERFARCREARDDVHAKLLRLLYHFDIGMWHDDETARAARHLVNLLCTQHRAGTDQRPITQACTEDGNTFKRSRGIEWNFDDREAVFHQCLTHYLARIGANAAQDCDERTARQGLLQGQHRERSPRRSASLTSPRNAASGSSTIARCPRCSSALVYSALNSLAPSTYTVFTSESNDANSCPIRMPDK